MTIKKDNELPPAKAGIQVFGLNDEGERSFLVPYNEGRFAKNGVHLVLAKGSIDKGETVLMAALRELNEETGFDLLHFLGGEDSDNVKALERGETVRDLTHPDYPGVRLIKFDPKPYPHIYHSRAGAKQSMVMFGVEVEGIDKIRPLKNEAGETIKDHLRKNPALHRFPTFLEWMKQGYIPAEDGREKVELCDPQWFVGLLKDHGLDKEPKREEWQHLCATMPSKDYKIARECFSRIKLHLHEIGMLGDDTDNVKFDEKDCPLFWYVEGGTVRPVIEVLTKVLRDMKENEDYALAFGGNGTKLKDLSEAAIRTLGQVAGFSPFALPEEWQQAYQDVYGTARGAGAMIGHGDRIREARRERAAAADRTG